MLTGVVMSSQLGDDWRPSTHLTSPKETPMTSPTTHDLPGLLDKLRQVDAQAHTIDADRAALVREARAQGATWEQVGEALGVTKQSAWEQFRKMESA